VVNPRELNDWRALTVTLVSRAEESTTGTNLQRSVSKQEEHSESILEMISVFAKQTEDVQRIKESLKGIIQKAIDMALVLRKQRASWSIKFPPPTAFDTKTMEDSDEDEDEGGVPSDRHVALFISPGLYKRGNADGEHYDIESCLVRSRVKV